MYFNLCRLNRLASGIGIGTIISRFIGIRSIDKHGICPLLLLVAAKNQFKINVMVSYCKAILTKLFHLDETFRKSVQVINNFVIEE